MDMKFEFNHSCFSVLDLERSLRFYEEALGFRPVRVMEAPDGSFKLVFVGDGITDFSLELSWMRDRKEPYDLGEGEFHLAIYAPDFEAAKAHHREMGVICFENPELGVYFIEDPDGYWIEIVPGKG